MLSTGGSREGLQVGVEARAIGGEERGWSGFSTRGEECGLEPVSSPWSESVYNVSFYLCLSPSSSSTKSTPFS